ncbi:protein with ubiquitin conjugating enzyme domain [Klebsormidium nitens]|uniref:Protein with ubiquitin conjugating enzyme domain n=1 Tax=Klebsormidium nitens TaxID=105231 RepID=A0A1Y1I2K5_KLENI|nr:protein with ubiquitin conjugating enzyme domain [Klebsormidium nitens]|eukprot:GAQ84192.1 protein with ubiquitin conjugating enzyme domain [Klebsormidium nitens]
MAVTERCREIEKQVKAWVDGTDGDTVKVLGVGSDSMKISVAGRQLSVSLPAAFMSGHRTGKDIDDGDQFFVTAATYEGQMEDMLQRINEKLERLVPADCTVPVLMEKLVGTVDTQSRPEQPRTPAGGASEDEEEEADDAYDPEEVSDMSDEGEDSDDEAPDFYGYDMATGDDIVSERELRVRKASYLYKVAEEARCQCAEAGEADEVFAEGSTYGILQWCSVEAIPDLLRVKLSWDLQGFMEKADALALGLIYEEPLVASLAFSSSLWVDPVLPATKKLAPEQVHVTQDVSTSRRESGVRDGDNQDQDTPGKNERSAYGSKVLVPELIHRFFRAHARIRSPHLDDEKSILTLMSVGAEHARASLLVRHARATSAESAPLDLNALVHCRRTDAELEEELGAINRAELGCTDEALAVEGNVFTAALQMVGAKLGKVATWCPVCRQPHASPGMRLRPCNNDLCLYRFEELGLGAAILPEVLENAELVELELAMAANAAASGRAEAVFEPFPSFLLEGRENRGRAGWFNSSPNAASGSGAHKPVAANAQAAAGGSTEKAIKMIAQLKEALEAVPPLKELTGCRSEAALITAFVNGWYNRPAYRMQLVRAKQRAAKNPEHGLPAPSTPTRDPKERDREMFPYDLVRFVLSSNRLSLRHLTDPDLLPLTNTAAQFVVLTADPEKEAAFAALRASKGSFFAFHGSSGENWYSILRNGLRSMSGTSYQMYGAAHGAGIYLAPALTTSLGYCARHSLTGWANGTYKSGFTCLAICEVVKGAASTHGTFCFVVPPGKEDHVVIRYLLVYDGATVSGAHNIADDKLDNVSLSEHFRNVTESVREARFARQVARHTARKRAARQAAAEAAAQAAAAAEREAEKSELSRRRSGAPRRRLRGVKAKTPAGGSASATQAIQKELAKMMALQTGRGGKGKSSLPAGGFEVDVDEEDLYKWRVKLRPSLFAGSTLEGDLQKAAKARHVAEVPVLLEIRFPSDFPWQPPFIRVVSPRFAFHTGHVTVGGSICMELLTASGWTPAYALESVLVQIIAEMMSGNARLDQTSLQSGIEYSEAEAKAAFTRVARDHGWKV